MILLRVSLFFIVLLLLPDWYIYKVYIKYIQHKWQKRLYWLPTVLLLMVLLVFIVAHDSLHDAFGIYLIVTLCVAVPKLVFVLCDILMKVLRKFLRIPLFGKTVSSVVTLAYLLFGAIKGKEYFQVKQVVFSSPDLPESFDGYRILQLSDIHAGSWKGNAEALRRAVEICNAQHPDLAVFTGDLVNSRADEIKEFMPVLSKLRAKDGVFSVLGNHDYATYVQWDSEADRLANIDTLLARQEQMGWKMLMNDHQILHRGNDSIALIGVENSGKPPFPDCGDLPRAQKGTESMFRVLLSHDPTHWRRSVLPDTDIQLMLAGHTHDMQINLFGFSFSQFIYPEHKGLYLEGQRGLYVNIGLGYVLFPMRLGAWPEITVITLRRK